MNDQVGLNRSERDIVLMIVRVKNQNTFLTLV